MSRLVGPGLALVILEDAPHPLEDAAGRLLVETASICALLPKVFNGSGIRALLPVAE